MKYIVVEKEGMEVAILFPEIVQHKEALNIQGDAKPVSAGFCEVTVDIEAAFPDQPEEPVTVGHLGLALGIRVWGGSNSLGLKSRDAADVSAIRMTFWLPTVKPEPEVLTADSR
jgi:hypothetical protein